MKKIILSICVPVLILYSFAGYAQTKPFQIALFNPVQIVSENDAIAGIRLNLIYGKNVSVTGLDFGFINHTTTGTTKGIQFGAVGLVESDFVGWQDNTINITKGTHEGIQVGIYNYAKHMSGVQFGLINYAVSMKGMQIGFINIIRQGGAFPVFPIVNWSF